MPRKLMKGIIWTAVFMSLSLNFNTPQKIFTSNIRPLWIPLTAYKNPLQILFAELDY